MNTKILIFAAALALLAGAAFTYRDSQERVQKSALATGPSSSAPSASDPLQTQSVEQAVSE